jgi:hypothetical protein
VNMDTLGCVTDGEGHYAALIVGKENLPFE